MRPHDPRAVIFDIGNVLIRWDARLLYRQLLPDEAAIDAFFAEIDFHAWNLELDRGARLGRGRRRALRPPPAPRRADRAPSTTAGTRRCPAPSRAPSRSSPTLAAAGVPLYAITNFSGAKWAETCARFPFLASVFRDVVVSGHEGLVKPDPAIYRRCLERNGLAAGGCVFIDDSPANVAGAAALGIDAIRFTTPAALRDDLAPARPAHRPSGYRLTSRNAPVRALGEAADLRRPAPARRGAAPAPARAPPRTGARSAGVSGPVSVMWNRKRSST